MKKVVKIMKHPRGYYPSFVPGDRKVPESTQMMTIMAVPKKLIDLISILQSTATILGRYYYCMIIEF
jgi:hypothetical protein